MATHRQTQYESLYERQTSFDKVILKNKKQFIGYAFNNNPDINSYDDFKRSFIDEFDTGFSEQTLITLFEDRYCKTLIKENVTPQQYEQLYGDGIIVERDVIIDSKPKRIQTVRRPKIIYEVNGHKVRRASSEPYSNSEERFLRIRKDKGQSKRQIIKDYQRHFRDQRTKKQLSKKIGRI